MFSSARDLARFAVAFVNEGKLEGRQVFAPSLIAKLSAPYISVPGVATEQKTGYGMTVETYRGVRLLKSSGSWGGFTTLFWIAPEHRFAVVLLANRNAAFFRDSAEKALSLMLPLKPVERRGRTLPLTMSRAEMSSYLGTYVNENVVEILLKDEKLWLKENDALQPITKIGEAHFNASVPGSDFTQEFFLVNGTNGKVEFLHRAGRALRKL
jgi:CubicO group peptidase (beta-lactamase class C family)